MLLGLTFLRITFNSKHRTGKIKAKNPRYRNMKNKITERQKPSFPKDQVENADLYKSVLNKIMTTRK